MYPVEKKNVFKIWLKNLLNKCYLDISIRQTVAELDVVTIMSDELLTLTEDAYAVFHQYVS